MPAEGSVKGSSSAERAAPLVGELDKNLKYDAPSPFTGERAKLKAFLIQLNLYMTFNGSRFTSETERVLYLARADAALVIINGFKNLAAFGISYAIIVWNNASGYAISFGVLGVIVFLAHVLAGVLWWKGDKIRRWTANKFEDGKETYHGEVF
jgi:hypothetical protein